MSDWVDGLTNFNRGSSLSPSALTAAPGTTLVRVPGWDPLGPSQYIRASITAVQNDLTTAILTCSDPQGADPRTRTSGTSDDFYATTCNPDYPGTLIYGPLGAEFSLTATGGYSSATVFATSISCAIDSPYQRCTATESVSVISGRSAVRPFRTTTYSEPIETGTLTITAGTELLAAVTGASTTASNSQGSSTAAPASTTTGTGAASSVGLFRGYGEAGALVLVGVMSGVVALAFAL